MMGFLLLLIFGLMHLVMFAVTRYMVTYAAFAASRAAVVGNSPEEAAEAVMANINWWADEDGEPPVEVSYTVRGSASGYEVTTKVPYAGPIYEWVDDGFEITAFAPANAQRDAPSGGDNE